MDDESSNDVLLLNFLGVPLGPMLILFLTCPISRVSIWVGPIMNLTTIWVILKMSSIFVGFTGIDSH